MSHTCKPISGPGIAAAGRAPLSCTTHLELRTDAGWLLLLVQVQQRLGSSVMQRHADDEPQGLRVQQVLGNDLLLFDTFTLPVKILKMV